ncbi:NAD-dependent epimerase/dehydratase family protein [Micromonospora sp. NPDC049559]|uniref:NAD-dependent epimerase/dehydratase family protein n=1 Tax=Micromonospora sp. NPDC049559 TaxID=3155923 RepID=UPI0034215B65
MTTCLVTGGAGFIGSHLATYLLDRGHAVVVLDDLSGGSRANVDPRAELVVGSVAEPSDVDAVFAAHKVDRVYHFAAFTAQVVSHFAKRLNYDANVRGSVNVINAAIQHRVSTVVFASSVAVYGDLPSPLREVDLATPVDSYGLGKLTVERELEITRRHFGLDYVAFRIFNVYGERQLLADPYRNAVGIFVNQVMRGEPLSVYGSGEQVRAFTYVSDIIPVLADAPEVPGTTGRIFNVGSNQLSSLNQLAEAVRIAMGVPDQPIAHIPARDEVSVVYTDTTLAREVFGNWADTPLAEGLARTVKWAAGMGPQELSTWIDLELGTDRLPDWLRHVVGRLDRQQ